MKKTLLVALFAMIGLTACSEAEKPEAAVAGAANPASVFCEEQGGEVVIKDENGGQVGYCKLSDGRLIEEWTFMNESKEDKAEPVANMANPASVFCEEQGGKVIIKDGENGQVGYCQLADGTEVEEWEYFRQHNNEEEQTAESTIGMANPASVFCEEQGGKTITKDGADGQYSVCQLADGTEVEEWEYFRQHNQEAAEGELIGMANPSAVFCEEQGGQYFLNDEGEIKAGSCKLTDGKVVEAWEYYRANHKE